MSCSVEILVEDIPEAVYAPVQAVVRHLGENVAFVHTPGGPERYQLRAVAVGSYNDRWVEIESGLEPGEVVLLAPPPGFVPRAEVKTPGDPDAPGAPGEVEGHLLAYDLHRDIALVSMRPGIAVRPVRVAPAGYRIEAGTPAFTLGCDKGADATVRETRITAIDKYHGRPNITSTGEPIDGRSGGGLFTAEGLLIGICNAADPQDKEGIYAGLPSIHWQLDEIGQSRLYRPDDTQLAKTSPGANPGLTAEIPDLPPTMPGSRSSMNMWATPRMTLP